MVCFVDDDIVCEGYSVTEEVFLLKPAAEDEVIDIDGGTTTTTTTTAPGEDAHTPTGGALTKSAPTARGMVLDLHANPDAKGSRFENPLWWRYLPSLKPLGMSALLTYKAGSVPTTVVGSDAISTYPYANSQEAHAHTHTHTGTSAMEQQLVHHIRRAIPLEAMRELAEEIGFEEDDVQG